MSSSSDRESLATSAELRGATWFLVAAAALTTEAARWSNLHAFRFIACEFATSAVLAIGLGWSIRKFTLSQSRRLLLTFIAVIAMGLIPAAFEFSARSFAAEGQPPEVVQLAILRNLMLTLAATAVGSKALRLSCVLSLFMVLGSLVLAQSIAPYILSIVYGVVGLWWLMGAHWEHVNVHRAASTRIRMPTRVMGGTFTIAVALAILAIVGVARWERVVALSGWFWGSGGELYSDPYALRGEHSGTDVVAATKDVDVIGATESDIFLSSHKPSLFDMFSDMLGETVRSDSSGDAQSILFQETAAVEKKLFDDKSGDGGTFNTRRKPAPTRKVKLPGEERASDAVMMVTGRTPLHLRLATFDTFDGSIWSRSDVHSPSLDRRRRERATIRDVRRGDHTWFEVERLHETIDDIGHRDAHKIAIVNLRTNRVPCPVNPQALHIDKVDRTGLIEWHDDGCFFMPGRTAIPSLQVLNVESVTLKAADSTPTKSAKPLAGATSPVGISTLVQELADQWTRGVEQPHDQILTIVLRLRERCRFIPQHGQSDLLPAATGEIKRLGERATALVIEQNAADTIDTFLSDCVGPDYMFAGAAVRLFQSLGFEARLASGFYVSEAANRRFKKQTTVLPEDLHFWAEVLLEDGNWLTVDPSPGFPVLQPPRSLLEVARDISVSILEPVAKHPIAAIAAALLALALWWWRHHFVDSISIASWRMGIRGRQAKILGTIAILERRFRWEGLPRSRQTTIRRWLRQCLPGGLSDSVRERCLTWIDEASRCLYAEHLTFPDPVHAVDDECELVLVTFSIVHIAGLARGKRRMHPLSFNGTRGESLRRNDADDACADTSFSELATSI